jgi:hypothetical protein
MCLLTATRFQKMIAQDGTAVYSDNKLWFT